MDDCFSIFRTFLNVVFLLQSQKSRKKVTRRRSCRSKDEKALLSKELRKGFISKRATEFQEKEEAEGIKT